MSEFSKLIGALIGAGFGALVAFAGLPEELASPEIQGGVIAAVTGVFVYFFPANTPAE